MASKAQAAAPTVPESKKESEVVAPSAENEVGSKEAAAAVSEKGEQVGLTDETKKDIPTSANETEEEGSEEEEAGSHEWEGDSEGSEEEEESSEWDEVGAIFEWKGEGEGSEEDGRFPEWVGEGSEEESRFQEWAGEGGEFGFGIPSEESELESEYGWKEKASEESLDYDERRYLVGTHSFLHLKDPGLAIALIPEEKVPEKVYKGLKAEKHEYKKLCDELGIRPVKAFLDQMHSEVLDLRNYALGAKDLVAIAKMLCNNRFVKYLYLSGNFAGQVGGDAIAEMIENNEKITHLDIGGTFIGPSIKKICEGLKNNGGIESLDLSMNDLTNKEMPPLADALLGNANLKELFLQHNKFTDGGLAILGDVMNTRQFNKKKRNRNQIAVKKNEWLEVLDLGWNRIKGENDSEEFFAAASYHPALRWLNLAGNSINNSAGISRLLSGNEQLEFMNIGYNRLTGKACPAIGRSLAWTKSNSTLTHFVAGPNLWRQKESAQLMLPLTAWRSLNTLEEYDMSLGMVVSKKFLKTKRKVWKVKPKLEILHSASSYAITKAKQPDPQVLTIKRANTVCENFVTPLGMLIDELRIEPEVMRHDQFKKFIKSCNLYKDKVLTETFFKYFPVKSSPFEVDCKAIIEVYDKVYPNPKVAEEPKAEEGEAGADTGTGELATENADGHPTSPSKVNTTPTPAAATASRTKGAASKTKAAAKKPAGGGRGGGRGKRISDEDKEDQAKSAKKFAAKIQKKGYAAKL